MANAPLIKRMPPSRESSPKNNVSCKKSALMVRNSAAVRMPMAIGRSKSVPSFFKSAGAKLTVIFFEGS